jgi:FAD/FMN-containing dehydrogenase/Fe-S oxidoreductase
MPEHSDPRRQKLARLLRERIAGEVRFDAYSRMLYSTDASIYQIEPVGVVIPQTVEDIRAAVTVAADQQVPIVPRGAGTSLSGQSIGPAIIIDFSKYLNRIIDIDLAGRRVRVEPGVVLDQLNAALAPYGLQFGPDVATSNRANLGGMIGNNSAGARSILYGKTVDHVRELSVLLADGTTARFGPLSAGAWGQQLRRPGAEGDIYRTVDRLARQHAAEIRRRYPRILRRVSGYNLDEFVDGGTWNAGRRAAHSGATESASSELNALASATAHHSPLTTHQLSHLPGTAYGFNLSKLIVGSEGTLAVVTEAVLDLVPRPAARGLVMVHFDRMDDALVSLGEIMRCRPSAVELIDRMVLDLAAQNLEIARQLEFVHGKPDAILMVEFSGDTDAGIAEQADELEARLARRPAVGDRVRALEPRMRDAIWKMRSAGAALLLGIPGARKPIAFVEDTAVSPDRLPEFVRRFKETLARHGTTGSFYGHASVGCLHIRPLLDLKSRVDVRHMRQIAEEVADLVLEFDGAMSGEHGDGLARSMWNEKLFGPELYRAFREVKAAFDPKGLMNPGKIVDAPEMCENLRYREGYRLTEPETVLDFSRQGGIGVAAELCNGAGACRKLSSGTMCPSFMATREEEHTTRGRANALRAAMAGQLPGDGLGDPRLYQVLDLCLMCKACKAECPSNVDLAKLKAEFLHHYYRHNPMPLGNWLMGHIRTLNRLGSMLPGVANWLLGSRGVKWLLEQFADIDRRRALPRLARQSLQAWFRRRTPAETAGSVGRVVLFDDCFTCFNEPEIGHAAVRLLEAAGYRVELAGIGCCGRPMTSKGLLDEARKLAASNVAALESRVGPDVPLVGCEPSCILTFIDEYRDFRLGPAADRVAEATHLLDAWLAAGVHSGRHRLALRPRSERVLAHGHCHQKALVGTSGMQQALELVPELAVHLLDAGCCGMAGSFGYEREHFEVSRAIAERGLLKAVGAEPDATLIAPGHSCRTQLRDLARRAALHPLQLLAEQLE